MRGGVTMYAFFLAAALLLLYSYYAKILDWILIVMAFPIGMAVLAATGHPPGTSSLKWWLGAFLSTALFWAIIKQFRRSWRNEVFWPMIGILAVLQALLMYLVGRNVDTLSSRWAFPMFMFEGPIIMITLELALCRWGKHRRGHRGRDA